MRPALETSGRSCGPEFDDARYLVACSEGTRASTKTPWTQLRASEHSSVSQYDYGHPVRPTPAIKNHQYRRQDRSRRAAALCNHSTKRARAGAVAYMASNSLAVQFVGIRAGARQMVTTRVPMKSTGIPLSKLATEHAPGAGQREREVLLWTARDAIVVEAGGARLRLNIEDPSRVGRMATPAPPELLLRAAGSKYVIVEYAVSKNKGTDGVVSRAWSSADSRSILFQ